MISRVNPYDRAQRAIAELKMAVHDTLAAADEHGLSNAEIGRQLGIYFGHKGHVGHVPRAILALMELEGSVVQDDETTRWRLS